MSELEVRAPDVRRESNLWFQPILIGTVTFAILVSALFSGWYSRPEPTSLGVLPGEFEHNEAILFCWFSKAEAPQRMKIMVSMIRATQDKAELIILVDDAAARSEAIETLESNNIPQSSVTFVEAFIDTPWLRDFGPLVIKGYDGTYKIVDARYEFNPSDAEMSNADRLPTVLAKKFGMEILRTPMFLEGGNVLSNGAGLCLTTRSLIELNKNANSDSDEVTSVLKKYLGATQVVILEPLRGEPTGHVDMFATFTAPDRVVVGQYSPKYDPVNARILDENAAALAGIKTACGPLKVERIPMPIRSGGVWKTYTNVLFANGVLLVPSYRTADPEVEARAMAIYRKLLPGWNVVGIECQALMNHEGALHCVTMNLFRVSSKEGNRKYGPF